jgi:hypothetical protein
VGKHSATEPVLTLLGLLQQRQVWTGPELARERCRALAERLLAAGQ